MEETNIDTSRAAIEEATDELIADWCNDFCDIVHLQCIVTYGHRHGFEEERPAE